MTNTKYIVIESGKYIMATFERREQAENYAKDAKRFTHHTITVVKQ